MPEVAVIDAMEDILRDAGVYDEIKQTLFLAVNKNAKVKEFGSTTDGENICVYAWLIF